MTLKRLEIIIEEDGDHSISTNLTNSGFSALELMGLLETKKIEIFNQLHAASVKEDGK